MKVFSPLLNGTTTTTGSFNVPNHPTSASISNPLTGSLFNDTTEGILKVYNGNEWTVVGEQVVPVALNTDIEYLVVAGGGGAGFDLTAGGGAGGLLSSSLSSVVYGSEITVTIGAGGAGYTTGGVTSTADGTSSSIASAQGTAFTTVSTVGGGGGSRVYTNPGRDGGSGGGCGRGNQGNTNPGSGTVGQGNAGGADTNSPAGTGGGGAGEVGGTANGSGNPSTGGDGGDGKQSNITGTATYYAGGGGGGGYYGSAGSGGQGGGGTGSGGNGQNNQESGDANTGGGGGGGGQNSSAAGSGGSGLTILAYDSASMNCAGGIVGDAGNGRKYHQFNSSDTFKVGATSDFGIVTTDLQLHLDAGNFASRGTSTWSDLTANGYNSTLVSSPALGENFYYDFDGSADYGTFASAAHTAISSHTQGTVECWVNGDSFTSGTGRKTIFGTGHSSQTDRWCVIRVHQNNNLQMSINADGTSTGCNTTTTLPSTGTWYHLVITYNGSSFAAYYDGVSQAINTAGGGWFNSVGSNTLQVGAMDRGTSGNNYDPWNGKIAQVRVYSSALSATEVLQNYEATKTNFV